MNCFQLIFSPTGGTERVAKALTQNWPAVQTIDLSVQNFTAPAISFHEDDLVLIALPVFEGMAPQPALDRLALLQGNGARCALAAVYGNRAVDNALAQMEDHAQNAGFHPIAAVSAVAAHSLLPTFAIGRPDAATVNSWRILANRSSKNSVPVSVPVLRFPENTTAKRNGPG